jgi:hypothetical protein
MEIEKKCIIRIFIILYHSSGTMRITETMWKTKMKMGGDNNEIVLRETVGI